MAILPGYEYDIFVSYRHNDNRSGWVTEFVKALQEEIASTIKNPVSVYFDTNPHDGLLETHNVDKSLEGKLKCLIFIPIISQTYCDPKSFAWQHEFCAFNRMANEDQFGRDIKLSNGNVTSRILPVKIHDLDAEDKSLLESEMGGVLRAIEFIYKEAGVNRPLKYTDNKTDNQNKTDYRNQINKTSNAIKEIIQGLKNFGKPILSPSINQMSEEMKAPSPRSIAVLPFLNISNDPDQEYFSDGLTEEIIADLSKVNELVVISRSSIMTLKGSQKKIKEIAHEVNVRYVLEGSVRKSGSNLRITAQLIDAINDSHLWAEKYNGTLEDVFDIQEKVSRSIVDALKLKLSPEEDNGISQRLIVNVQAYECYLKARQEMYRGTRETMEHTIKLIQNGLDLVGPNELLFASLGYANYFYFRFVNKLDESYLLKAKECAAKAFNLNPKLSHIHVLSGWIYITEGKLLESARSMKQALLLDSNNCDALIGLAECYLWTGKDSAAAAVASKLISLDPLTPLSHIIAGAYDVLNGRYEKSLPFFEKACAMDSSPVNQWQLASAYIWCGRNADAFLLIDQLAASVPDWPITKQILFLKYGLQGDKVRALAYATNDLETEALNDHHFSFHLAECYAVIGEKTKALDFLEHAIIAFFPYVFLATDPLFANISSEERFKNIVSNAKQKSDAFEV